MRLASSPISPALLAGSSSGGVTTDRYGTMHSVSSTLARDAFAEATEILVTHRPGIMAAIDRALTIDPHMIAAYLLEGFVNVILSRPETIALAVAARAQAIRAATVRGRISPDELVLLRALDFAVAGHVLSAAEVLDERLSSQPCAVLLAKLSHWLRFMAGDAAGMLRTSCEMLASATPDMPGFSYLLGLHACALVENGEYAAALRFGTDAVEREPHDTWSIHAVAHVFEMTSRPKHGIAWLCRSRPSWARCGSFTLHMAWHLALFHLEQGDHMRALDLYDQAVRPVPSKDQLDVANAISLLFRLQQDGVNVGNRWVELAEIGRMRRHECNPIIAGLHNLIALAVSGDAEACSDVLRAMEATAEEASGDQSRLARTVGIPMARLMFAAVRPWGEDGSSGKPLEQLASQLAGLGWGQAERDVFMRFLAMQAARLGDRAALSGILAVRRRLKRDDHFIARLNAAYAGL